MNISELWLFLFAAIALLGSPGPAIAAILAVGKSGGWVRGLGFYGGLQVGLATAAAISIVGLFAVLSLFPQVTLVMSVIATFYLLYLAYGIATSPVEPTSKSQSKSSSSIAGLLLGVTNPKAYIAFASLFASFTIVANNDTLDSLTKWLVVVIVMIVVDLIWLWIGVRLGQLDLSRKSERLLNFILAAMIVVAAIAALI